MERADCGENWILLLWAMPCSVSLYSSFLLMGVAVFPPCSLACQHASQDCCSQCPWPCGRPLSTHTSTGASWTLTASLTKSLVESLLLSPGSWCAQGFVHALQESLLPQFCGSSVIISHWPSKSNSLEALNTYARSPSWEICCEPYNFHNCARTSLE